MGGGFDMTFASQHAWLLVDIAMIGKKKKDARVRLIARFKISPMDSVDIIHITYIS